MKNADKRSFYTVLDKLGMWQVMKKKGNSMSCSVFWELFGAVDARVLKICVYSEFAYGLFTVFQITRFY